MAIGELSAGGTIIGGMIGQRGAQGIQGEQGIQGIQGETGETGNGIASIVQTSTSTEDEGINVVTITETNGNVDTFEIRNGSKGSKGDKGDTGDKGEPGQVRFLVVNELPETGRDDTIYLLPLENPTEEGNNYAEYIYVNNQWELLGKIGVHVDLTDYVKNTDYASGSKYGVVKVGSYGISAIQGVVTLIDVTYNEYLNKSNAYAIAKGTLENVITGKDLTTKAYVDGLVGDINSALDAINGEVI